MERRIQIRGSLNYSSGHLVLRCDCRGPVAESPTSGEMTTATSHLGNQLPMSAHSALTVTEYIITPSAAFALPSNGSIRLTMN